MTAKCKKTKRRKVRAEAVEVRGLHSTRMARPNSIGLYECIIGMYEWTDVPNR